MFEQPKPSELGTPSTTPVRRTSCDDDVLNFRAQPDPSSEILVTVAPMAEVEILTLGKSWSAAGGVWWRVRVDGQMA